LVRKYENKRQLSRLKITGENNIKLYLNEIVCEGVDLIQQAEDSIQ
jgi:hypothetical protein